MLARYSNRRLKTFCCRCECKRLIAATIVILCIFLVQLAHSDPAVFDPANSTINIPTLRDVGSR